MFLNPGPEILAQSLNKTAIRYVVSLGCLSFLNPLMRVSSDEDIPHTITVLKSDFPNVMTAFHQRL